MINVVNKYKHKQTDNDIYIGRGSVLGNPYTSIKDRKTKAEFICENREESVEKYREWLTGQINNKNKSVTNILNEMWKINKEGGEVNLVCFCVPKLCHGEIIKEVILNKS